SEDASGDGEEEEEIREAGAGAIRGGRHDMGRALLRAVQGEAALHAGACATTYHAGLARVPRMRPMHPISRGILPEEHRQAHGVEDAKSSVQGACPGVQRCVPLRRNA
ncbi:hypothetical protein GOP47_0009927, partial [Adiantum capillus-veneris]